MLVVGRLVPVEPVQQVGQVAGGELPGERASGRVVARLEVDEAFLDSREVSEVVGRYDFSLDDGEVDLDLVSTRRRVPGCVP